MPVYNERLLLARSIARLRRTIPPLDAQGHLLSRILYLVDDGSTDGTIAEARRLATEDAATQANPPSDPSPGHAAGHTPIVLLEHAHNRGKGAAIRTALARALADGCDVVIIHDADLEYDPADHDRLIRPITDGLADAVIGSRFLGETHRVLYFWHYQANRFITLCCNAASNLNLSDIECCLKALSRAAAERLILEEDRFGIEPELIIKLAGLRLPAEHRDDAGTDAYGLRRARIYEVAVTYAGRTYAEGKKIHWTDGLHALACIAKYGLLRRFVT